MSFADEIAVGSLVVSLISLILMFKLTLIGISLTAQPKINIEPNLSGLCTQQRTDIIFHLKNVGRWYAKPAATNVTLYINFPEEFDIKEARYGAVLGNTGTEVRRGKNNSKYIKVSGIHLHYNEPREDVHINLVAPSEPRIYKGWIAAEFNNFDLGVHEFTINVISCKCKN